MRGVTRMRGRALAALLCLPAGLQAASEGRDLALLENAVRARTLAVVGRAAGDMPRDRSLRAVARSHSRDQFERGELTHTSRNGDSPAQRVASAHRRLFGLVSENVAYQANRPDRSSRELAERVVAGWMDSPGHRRNIEANYQRFEVGCHGTEHAQYCTQLFVDRVAYLGEPAPDEMRPGEALAVTLSDDTSLHGVGALRMSLAPEGTPDPERSSGLTHHDGRFRGRLTAPTRPGEYQLALWRATAENPRRFEIVPGPFVRVNGAATASADERDTRP